MLFFALVGRQEVLAVERRVLLETLPFKLPQGTISYSSKLKSIARQGPDGTLLELEDGRQVLSKVTKSFSPLNKSDFLSSKAELEMSRSWLLSEDTF